MNLGLKLRIVAVVLMVWSSLAPGAELVRLAVLPTHADFALQADLLTTRLSSGTNVTLLEREAISRIWKEQAFSATLLSESIKLGRLLNADGLVMLDRAVEGTNELLSMRLLAVKPGVIISEHRFILPMEKPVEWVTDYAEQLIRRLPKFAVKKQDAVPLSLLNLRSSVSTADGLDLERELTSLLHLRLAREPSIFVLERRRLEELQEEKELGMEAEPFWNGAYVVDGVINRDAISKDMLTIHARVTRAKGSPVNLEIAGRRDQASAAVDELARKIQSAINPAFSPTAWDTSTEAKEYLREASWAWRWSRFRESAEAADASWYLGERTAEVGALRVISRARVGLSMRGPWPFEGGPAYWFRPPPASEGLTFLSRALEIYRELFPNFTSTTNDPFIAWGSVGMDTLLAASRMLDRYQENVEFTHGHEEELQRLRAACREVNTLLTTNPLLGPVGWQRDLRGLSGIPLNLTLYAGRASAGGSKRELWSAWLNSYGNWYDTPEDAVALYQRLLEPGLYRSVRQGLLQLSSPLTAWTVRDRGRLGIIWGNFLRQMVESTNGQMRLDGLRLTLEHSIEPNELDKAAREYAEASWAMRLDIFNRKIDSPVETVLGSLARRVEGWGQPAVEPLISLKTDWLSRFGEAAPDLSFAVWRELISNLTNKSLKTFGFSRPQVNPRPEQVRQLLAAFDAIDREGKVRRNSTKWYRDELKQLEELNGTGVAVSTSPSVSVVDRETVVAKLSRQLLSDEVTPPPNRVFWGRPLKNPVWHNNRLWLETSTRREDRTATGTKPALVAWDPLNGRSELIEAPFEGDDYHPAAPRFSLLVGDQIYLSAPGALWLKDGRSEWRQLPVPAIGWAVPSAFGDHVVLSAEGSILDVDPKSSSARILASTRRNPPQNSLDSVTSLRRVPLAVWPDGSLRALVDGKIWKYNANSQDWLVTHSATNCGEHLSLSDNRVIYRQTSDCGPGLLGSWLGTSEVLDYLTANKIKLNASPGRTPPFTPPLWLPPPGCQPFDRAIAFDGPRLWVFPKRVLDNPYDLFWPESRPSEIVHFDPRFRRGLALRLEIPTSNPFLREIITNAPSNINALVEFLHTSAGIAVVFRDQGTVLWFSKAEINTALAAAASHDRQSQRSGFTDWQQFDRDGNGWLDDRERRTMQRDSSWQTRTQASLDRVISEAVKNHDTEWNTLFSALDKNNDKRLSIVELGSAVSNELAFLNERLIGVNTGLAQAIRPFDLDNDASLGRAEFKDFLADPRPFAEINRSVEWVVRFGLNPQQCDTNDDGVLDTTERKLVNRLIRQRVGAKANPE